MALDRDVASIHDILVAYTLRQRTPSGPFSVAGSLTILGLISAAVLLWVGASMDWAVLLWAGMALLLAVLLVMTFSLLREVGRPGLQMVQGVQARASAEIPLIQDLQAFPLPALTEVEALLNQRIAAIEAAMAFLLGGLKTAGILGSLAVMLGAWSALTTAFVGLKPYSYLFGGLVVGVLLAGERLERGLEQLRMNRDLVSRAIAVRKLVP